MLVRRGNKLVRVSRSKLLLSSKVLLQPIIWSGCITAPRKGQEIPAAIVITGQDMAYLWPTSSTYVHRNLDSRQGVEHYICLDVLQFLCAVACRPLKELHSGNSLWAQV